MNGLTVNELREAGSALRHQSGVNTCARCLSHFFQQASMPAVGSTGAAAVAASQPVKEECFVHTRDLTPLVASEGASPRVYPCCGAAQGTRGCTAAPHLPMFQTVSGQIQPNRRIDYGAVDLHAGRWVSTRMSLQQLSSAGKGEGEAAASKPQEVAAPVLPVSTLPLSVPEAPASLGDPVPRVGDEIMICGRLYHTGTPVVLWGDVGGYDHYRVERRYVPFEEASWATTQKEVPSFTTPNRYGLRKDGLTDAQVEAVRGGQWDLPTLQQQMRQFVLHYDETGTSRECFRVLQDVRDLSIHFMCDLDGTIYQALDLKERAFQATIANTTSVGCEIANIGAYDPTQPSPLAQWYGKNAQGQTIITIPPEYGDGGIRTPGFVGQPARSGPVAGNIQGQNLVQFDYTPQQYAALSKLIAAFCTIFPKVPPTYPVDAHGSLITVKLPDATLATYSGLLGHYHIQTDKIDPGPAMQWPLIANQAKQIMAQAAKAKATMQAAAEKAAPAAGALTSTVSAADNASEAALLRKLERKIFAAAEESASASLSAADKFYLVEGAWHSAWKAWLSASDTSATRPGPVPNLSLLSADERTPRAGLSYPSSYRAVPQRVWQEISELYGADAAIVRSSTDIYQRADGKPAAPAASVSAPAPAAVASASAAAAASASAAVAAPAPGAFAVPEIDAAGEEPWIVVTKRVTA